MTLVVGAGNAITGEYASAVSDEGAQTPSFPLFGTTSDDLIAFTVNWGAEITSWIGHAAIADHNPEILTLWQLVKCVPDIQDPETQWKTIMSGADTFHRDP
jgi:hypothetical protein